MPCLVVNTNVSRSDIPSSFVLELSTLIAKLTGKPESYVAIQVNPDQLMAFGGSSDPCAVCTIGNIGKLNNKDFTKATMEKIEQQLNIPAHRIYIFFSNLSSGDVGHNKSTF